jgi:hypothetical protein
VMNVNGVIAPSRSGGGKMVKFRVKGGIGDGDVRLDPDGDAGYLKVTPKGCILFSGRGHIDRQPWDNGVKSRLHDRHFGIISQTSRPFSGVTVS